MNNNLAVYRPARSWSPAMMVGNPDAIQPSTEPMAAWGVTLERHSPCSKSGHDASTTKARTG